MEKSEIHASDVIKEAGEYIVFTFDSATTTEFERHEFDEPEDANQFRQGKKPVTFEQRKIVEGYSSKESFLNSLIDKDDMAKPRQEKSISTANGGLEPSPESMYGMPVDEFEKKFKKIKKKFKQKRQEFEEKAKAALLEAAKLYLGEKAEEAYVKYKMELSQHGLSSIMYQIFTMEDALHSIAARIRVTGAHVSPRDIEVFTGLQRIILDAQKFQFDYLSSIESSLKELKADYELMAHMGESHKLGTGSGGDGEELIFMKGKDLIKKLANIKSEAASYIATPSKNRNLNPNAGIEDVSYEEAHKDTGTALVVKNPMSGYEGAAKKPKKERDEFGEEGNNDDYDL